MSKKKGPSAGESPNYYQDETGHWVILGGRGHEPAQFDPTRCSIPECDRVLTDWSDHDPLAAILAAADEPGSE